MSVYTSISKIELEEFLALYAKADLISFKGVEGGIENTNYFVTLRQGEFVLTIFEAIGLDILQPILALAHHLGEQGLSVPAPLMAKNKSLLQNLKGKPAVLCPRLKGVHITHPTPEHCLAIGRSLADFHLKAQGLKIRNANLFGLPWWQEKGADLVAELADDKQAIFFNELEFHIVQKSFWQSLPRGWVHADLFHDNALFDGEKFAILDLYAACEEAFIYDLAVLANDWCCDKKGQWQKGCLEALFSGYQSLRPLSQEELRAWPLALRAGALRWWLGRLSAQRLQASYQADLALKKDPDEYLNKLILRREEPHSLL